MYTCMTGVKQQLSRGSTVQETRLSWSQRASCIKQSKPFQEEKPNRLEYAPICNDCPVKNLCLSHAIVNKEKGIWGGMTYLQRTKLPAMFLLSLNLQEVPVENVCPEPEIPKEPLYPIEKLAQLQSERRERKRVLRAVSDSKELLENLDVFLLSLPDTSSLLELLAE